MHIRISTNEISGANTTCIHNFYRYIQIVLHEGYSNYMPPTINSNAAFPMSLPTQCSINFFLNFDLCQSKR